MAEISAYLPTINSYAGVPSSRIAQVGSSSGAPAFNPYIGAYDPATPGWFAGGVASGYHDLLGLGGAAIAAAGNYAGVSPVQQYGESVEQSQAEASAAAGRPDLEGSPFQQSLSNLPAWAGYQTAKFLPQLIPQLAAHVFVPEAAVPADISRLGTVLPRFLGGGALRAAGGDAAKVALAEAAGKQWGKSFVGNVALNTPLGVGGAYEAAQQAPGGADRGAAGEALALGPMLGVLGSVAPTLESGILARGMEGGILKRAATGAFTNASVGAVQSGLQTAITQSMQPDLSPKDRAQNIVDSVVNGGVVGGVVGGVLGALRKVPAAKLAETPTEALDNASKQLLLPPPSIQMGDSPDYTKAPEPEMKLLGAPQSATENDGQMTLPGMGGKVVAPEAAVPEQAPVVAPTEEAPFKDLSNAELYDRFIASTRNKPVDPALAQGQALEQEQFRAELRSRVGPQQQELIPDLEVRTKPSYAIDPESDALRPEAKPEADPRIVDVRKQAAEMAGRKSQFTQKLEAKDLPDLVNAVRAKLEAGNSSEAVMKIAEKLGVLDKDGQERDHAKDLQIAQSMAERAYLEARDNPNTPGLQKKAAEVQRIAGEMKAKQDVLDEANRRASAPEPETQAPPAPEPVKAEAVEAAVNAPPTGEAPKIDISAVPKPAPVPADPVEASVTMQEHHDPLTKIETDTSLPLSMRRNAAVVKDALARGVQGASQQADVVRATYALHNGAMMFRADTAPAGSKPLSDGAFGAVLAKVTGGLPDEVRKSVQVVQSFHDLPSLVQAAAAKQNFPPENVRGAAYDGKVYIVRDRTTSVNDLNETLKHEVFGHGAAQALYGDKFDATMDRAFTQAGGVDGLRALAKKFGVGDAFEEYIPKGQLGAGDRIRLTDELLAQAAGKASGTLKNAVMAWVGGLKSAMVSVLEKTGFGNLAAQMKRMDASDVAYTLNKMRKALVAGSSTQETSTAFRAEKIHDTIEQLPGMVKGVLDAGTKAVTDFATNGVSLQKRGEVRQKILKYSSLFNMAEVYKNIMPEVGQLYETNHSIDATRARFSKVGKQAVDPLIDLEKTKPKAAEEIRKAMEYAATGFNPMKKWDEHTWLHSAEKLKGGAETARDAANKKTVADANETMRKINQLGAGKVYTDLVAGNEALRDASDVIQINHLVRNDPVLRGLFPKLAESAMDRFQAMPSINDSPESLRKIWRDEKISALTQIKQFRDALVEKPIEPEASWTPEQKKAQEVKDKALSQITSLTALAGRIATSTKATNDRPYFHLGRSGDYFVSATLAHDLKTGEAKSASIDATAKALRAAGFDEAEISTNVTNPKIYLRLDTQDQAALALRVIKDLKSKGHIDDEGGYKIGARHADTPGSKISEAFTQQIIDQIKNSPIYERVEGMSDAQAADLARDREAAMSQMKAMINDQLSDSNERKVLTERKLVQGFSRDMVRSYAKRYDIGASALAHMAERSRITETFSAMRDRMESARSSNMPVNDIFKLHDIYNEISTRESQKSIRPPPSWTDTLNAVTQAWGVGFSPSNMLVQLSQVPVLGYAELARKHGFVKSAQALGSATGPAFRIMKAIFAEAAARGWKNLGDADLTGTALRKAGIDDKTAAFHMRVGLEGRYDLASAARNLQRVGDNNVDSKWELTTRLASTTTMYAEVMSRLIMSEAARRLHGGEGDNMHAYVRDVLDQSMLTFQGWNTARGFGPNGTAGKLTQVALKFMNYQIQYTEKLYRELATVFSKHSDADVRKESLRFLSAHLAALTVLSGTMGLPAASFAAGAYDKLSDLFGADSSDINASWRNWLSSTFGHGVGEVLARGVPRALGFDISSRVGAQDIVPFTKLLTNHAKFQDAAAEWAQSLEGAPGGMVSNIVGGGIKLYNGQVLEGMKTALPSFLRGPLTAYQMNNYGYVDSTGNRIPMTPGARDILMQAVGLKPAEKANYDELKLERNNRREDLTYRAGVMRQNLAVAIEHGDKSAAQSLIGKAREWDQTNPNYAVLPSIASVLSQRAKARQMTSVFGPAANLKDKGSVALGQWYGGMN